MGTVIYRCNFIILSMSLTCNKICGIYALDLLSDRYLCKTNNSILSVKAQLNHLANITCFAITLILWIVIQFFVNSFLIFYISQHFTCIAQINLQSEKQLNHLINQIICIYVIPPQIHYFRPIKANESNSTSHSYVSIAKAYQRQNYKC
jgi:hypothetical protein